MISIPILQPSLNFYKNVPISLPLIPVMTSNTAPSGIAGGSWDYSRTDPDVSVTFNSTMAYYVFDNNIYTELWSRSPLIVGYSTYQFSSPKVVTRLYIMSYGFFGGSLTFQGSHDGTSYNNIGNNPYILNDSIDDTFTNTTPYSYYKISFNTTPTGGEGIRTIQLYGY